MNLSIIKNLTKEKEWEDNTDGRWGFDFPIFEVKVRMFDSTCKLSKKDKDDVEGLGKILRPKKVPSGKVYFMLGGQSILESEYINATDDEHCRKNCEKWIIKHFEDAVLNVYRRLLRR